MHPIQDIHLQKHWFVMRDLKRANTKKTVFQQLMELEMTVFTPMQWKIVIRQGKKIREKVPFIPDLLFVYATRYHLDPIVDRFPTLQYRWLRNTYREPMMVSDAEMERFIHAVNTDASVQYYLPGEITPEMCKRRIRIIGGLLDNYEGYLLSTRGSKVKRLLVELPEFFSVGVEVNPEYIEFLS